MSTDKHETGDGGVRCSAWLGRCPHCSGEAKLKIEPTPPPHPWDTTVGMWSENDKSARVECAECHCQTNSVPEDMDEVVIARWNKRPNYQRSVTADPKL